jgi:predicted AlkP superfamily pyrophosphatase or phosphodiesterase
MRRMWWAACLLAGCGAEPPHPPMSVEPTAPRALHAVIISVDGLRPDAIEPAHAENLLGLIRRGAYCPKARAVNPSVTLPNHTAMLTGLDVPRHRVTWNVFVPGYIDRPTALSVARHWVGPTAMLYSKSKLHYLASPEGLDFSYGPESDSHLIDVSAMTIAREFAREWAARKFVLTFIHFLEVDAAGHAYGWMGEKYLEAVEAVDRAVGTVIDAVRASGALRETVLIVSSDHGGLGREHHQDWAECTTIPWICAGPGVPAGIIIDREVRTYDTAPTALLFLGLKAGLIDGEPVREVFPR